MINAKSGITRLRFFLFTLVFVSFLSIAPISADENTETTSDPLQEYITKNDVYQGSDFAAAVVSGRRAFRNENYEFARGKYRIAQALSSNHPVPYFFEAHCYFAEGEFTLAYDALIQGFKFLPEWIRLKFSLTSEYRFEQDFEKQKNVLLDVLFSETLESRDYKYWFVLGYVYFFSEEQEKSVVLFKEVLKLLNESKDMNIAYKISEKFLIQLYDRGITSKPIVVKKPDELTGWKRKAIQQLTAEKFDKAVIICGEEGMKFRNAEALFWMSVFLIADNSYDLAFSILMRGSGIDASEISKIPSINDIFQSAKLLDVKKSAQRFRDKVLLALFEGNQRMVRESLESSDNKNFTSIEIDAIFELLKYRNELPDMPVLQTHSTDEKTENKPIENTEKPEKTEDPEITNDEIDLEKLKKQEEYEKKELAKQVNEKIDSGKKLLADGKFADAETEFKQAQDFGKKISADYFNNTQNASIYLDLAKCYYGLKTFDQASINLQNYLKYADDATKNNGLIFFESFKQATFETNYQALNVFCSINSDGYDEKFLKAYIDYFHENSQSSADLFSELFLNHSNMLANWYLQKLENKGVTPTTDPKIRAKIHLLKAEKFLMDRQYEPAQVEYQRAYNNLNTKDNKEALTGLLATLFFRATKAISTQKRSDFYAAASDYIRRYVKSIGEDNWKDFKLNLLKKFPHNDDFANAQKTLKKHLQERTLDFEAHYFLAFIYYFDKKWNDAKDSFEKFMRIQKDRDTLEVDYFIAACKNN